jgi:hypothetical protein
VRIPRLHFLLCIIAGGFGFLGVHRVEATNTVFQRGDLFVGGLVPSPIETDGRFDWFLPDGTLNGRLASPFFEFPYDAAFGRDGKLYVPTSAGLVRRFASDGTFSDNFGPAYRSLATSIVFDSAGNAYVAGEMNTGGNLFKLDPLGNIVGSFRLQPGAYRGSPGISAVDLAADQCTLHFTAAGKNILRYDVCQSKALPDLISLLPGRQANALRILGDGSVLIADTEVVARVSSSGTVIQTYTLPQENYWYSLALDIDGRSFWAAPLAGRFYKFDIATGVLRLGPIQTSDFSVLTVGVYGEPRAATGGVTTASIPAMAEWMLVLLAISLALLGAMRFRV